MTATGKKIKRVVEPKMSRNVDNTRGSHLWSYNHFRTSILTSLLNDLIDLENNGFENENICKQVQRSLEYFINASTHVPQGGFLSGGPLYKEIENFKEAYVAWNNVHGGDDVHKSQRRKYMRKLRDRRQSISNKVRRLQYELENNLDQKILHDSYRAIGEMITMVPNVFINLSVSYKDYLKRGGIN